MALPEISPIDTDPRVRVLDQLIDYLALLRQSGDFGEARFAIEMEEELAKRRDDVLSQIGQPAAA